MTDTVCYTKTTFSEVVVVEALSKLRLSYFVVSQKIITSMKQSCYVSVQTRSKDCKNNQIILRNGNPSTVKTKFFGVAGGRVQFEDCLFDGVESPEVLLTHKLMMVMFVK